MSPVPSLEPSLVTTISTVRPNAASAFDHSRTTDSMASRSLYAGAQTDKSGRLAPASRSGEAGDTRRRWGAGRYRRLATREKVRALDRLRHEARDAFGAERRVVRVVGEGAADLERRLH